MKKSRVSIIRCRSYNQQEVYNAVKKSVDLLGGMSAFVKQGEKVLLNPNLIVAKPPESGADTHPNVVRAVIRLVKEAGAVPFVADSPGVAYYELINDVYERSGIKRVCDEENTELTIFSAIRKINGFPIAEEALTADKIISIPKFKTHTLTILTGAVKNLFGLIPGLFKTECHRRNPKPKNLSKVLVDIFSYLRPSLSIVDGIVSMEGDGPTNGNLKNTNLILASDDAVAADSVLTRIMGLKPLDIYTTRFAVERNLGQANIEKIELLGAGLTTLGIDPFKLPSTSILILLPEFILKIAVKLLNFKLIVNNDECKRCALCMKGCSQKCIELKGESVKIDNSRCLLCLCCQEMCPENAIHIKKSLLAKIIGMF